MLRKKSVKRKVEYVSLVYLLLQVLDMHLALDSTNSLVPINFHLPGNIALSLVTSPALLKNIYIYGPLAEMFHQSYKMILFTR